MNASYKVVMVGNPAVGKTNLGLRFTKDIFRPDYSVTLGAEFAAKTQEIDGQAVTVQVWDTAGEERFRAVTAMFFRGAVGGLAVYDITSRSSFDQVPEWVQLLHEHCGEDAAIVLVGNKADQTTARCVAQHEGEKLAQQLGVSFFETSALEGTNVGEAFEEVVRTANQQSVRPPAKESVLLQNALPSKTRRCC